MDQVFRLSPQQRRLWKLGDLHPRATSPYRVGCAMEIAGELDVAILRAAVAAVAGRHEILRTVFRRLPDVELPVQAVLPPGGDLLREMDLTGLDPAEQERRIRGLLEAMAWTADDLAAEPPLRITLAALAPARSVLVIGLPALCADAAGLRSLVREIAAAYEGALPDEPPVQYADLAEWLNTLLEREDTKDECDRWLGFDPAALDAVRLPFEQRAPGAAFEVVSVPVPVPDGEAWGPVFLLAAWSALLSRWTGGAEITIGTLFEGRSYEGLEEAVGTLARVLPLSVRIDPGEPFAALLEQLDATVRDAHERQEYFSWEEPGFLPFAFEVEEEPQACPAGAVTFTPLAARSFACVDRFRLKLCGRATGLELQYDPAAFAQADVERLAGQLATFLRAALDDPGSPISRLEIVPPAEWSRLLELDADAGPPARGCVLDLFAEQVRRRPDAIAAVCREQSLTYAELSTRAGRLAHTLLRLGSAPGARVALCLPRGLEMLVGLLGTLQAGAAFSPLDPQQPAERLALMLEDLEPSVVLTPDALAAALDANGEEMASVVHEAGLAYVIFTSGSTGRPKGVAVEHRQLFNYVAGVIQRLELPAGASFATVSTFAADLGHTMIFPSLCTGGTLQVIEEEVLADPEALAEAFARRPVDCLKIVPSHLASLLAAASRPERLLPRLRLVLGGEACGPELIAALRRLAPPSCRIFNHYGPTETTVGVLTYPVPADGDLPGALPLGQPLPGTHVYVADQHQRLVPVWMTGELWIGGAGVARGYLGRPDATAERFLPAPWDGAPGTRLYRTGDLARRRPDGMVEFLGRCDDQVKLRGFRIEPGEIASQLLAHPAVAQAAVVLREGEGASEPRLVAYWVPVRGEDAGPGELRSFLAARLPAAMVPFAFVALGELPLTPNGKLDRKALPPPEQQAPEEGLLAPRTPVEEVLAGIWAELLGREQIRATDSFFDLGGHSLLATQLMSRLRRAFGIEMPLRDLFEAPVLASLASRVETALRAGAGQLAPPLVPLPRQGPLPLSFAQQRLWFIDQLEPGSPLYSIPVALRIEGPLHDGVLSLCLGEIVRRHEVLRTVYTATESSPVQVIQPAEPFRLAVVDLSGLPVSRREPQALALAGEEACRPFDLTCGPLLRGTLLRLAGEDHVAALTMHHIVSDGWSMGILVREVTALYAAFAENRPSPLPELPVQYADFAAWQSSWLQGEFLEGEIAVWRRQLAGLPPLLELPTDRPRPAVQSFRGATRPVHLPAGLTRQVGALSRREGATVFMVLLAGFQALLARYSGQQDLAVGSPVAGRNRMEIEGLIGFFVNTLVLRGNLTGEPSFQELLGRTRETALAAHTHQDLPFEKLVQELAPERSSTHTPLFQTMLALQNAPVESLEIRNLRLRPFSGARTTAKFDLALGLAERNDRLSGVVEFATDLYDATTVDRLIGHFERLLATAATTPDIPISALPLLREAESAQLSIEWNDTGQPVQENICLQDLFAASAAGRSDAIAAVFAGRSLTYGGLAERAATLAERLRAAGAGPETLVGICLDEGLERLVAVLGVFLAGAAYLPLDPSHPRERLASMIEDADVRVVLTEEGLRRALPATVETMLPDGVQRPGTGLPLQGSSLPLHLAYVIYTSGSTGRPNGVMVTHGSAVQLILYAVEQAGLGPHSRVLQSASFSFDASVLETWMALAAGATLVIVPKEARLSGDALGSLVRREQVTCGVGTPALLALLPDDVPSLDAFLVGGDRCPAELAHRWAPPASGLSHLFNCYGPTETTIYTVAADLRGSFRDEPPIGRPVANARAYVLDPSGGPVPARVPGELCGAGPGLARGYLNRPALTAERFVPDPFGEPGARLYRSGDLARWQPQGNLEFLGRRDHQVKIRGFRIEPGEIEAALAALAGVREAAVVVREDTPGDRRLVAYVAGQAHLVADELRRLLRERLPDYLVPAAFVKLAALPLNANGKVDRKALPAPERQALEETDQAPQTPVEAVLAGIWADLLGLERVGTADSFFDLGGHSLLATQVMSRLRHTFSVEMPLRDLFEAPVLRDLAVRVEAAQRAAMGWMAPPLVSIAPELPGRRPLSFAQQRLWFIDLLEPGSPFYNIPVALRVEGPLLSEVLALCLGEIVRRHETLRTVFAVTEGSPVQVIQPAEPFKLAVVDLSGLPDREREALALTLTGEEAARPFNLTCGPLLRGVLLRLAEGDHVVALTLHHIISDGWSMGILVREVMALYTAFAEERPSPLPELPVQYADFTVWQHSWLQGEILESEIAFWRQQLSGLPPLLELPTDRPRPAVQSFRGATQPVHLPAGLTRQAQALSRREGATLFMVLLAGFQALLARYSGQQDLAVGSPVAGRNRMEIEGLIGFFVNTLVLRGDLSGHLPGGRAGGPSFQELLGRVRETALAAYLHQDLPFEKLVQELAPERSLAHAPLFQVVLALQNAPVESLEIPDLRLRPVSRAGTTAKLDLTVSLGERKGELAGTVEYVSALFDATTIQRLTAGFERLLEGAMAGPDRAVADLPLLSPAELHQLRSEQGLLTEALPAQPGPSLIAMLEYRAERTPDATAVLAPGAALTWAGLDRRANRLAHRLRSLGVTVETRVGLFAERSPEMIATVLGILKAGAAYVPLDPAYPRERLAFLIEDARVPVLLTQERLLGALPEIAAVILLLDAGSSNLEPESEERLPDVTTSESLAYVIYTSGSTGRPKGVMVPHRGWSNLAAAQRRLFGLRPGSRVLQFASLSFDASAWEISMALGSGATLVLGPPERRLSVEELTALLQECTIATLPPTALAILAPEALPGLETLIVAGEACPLELARHWAAGRRLFNAYGPTEATVCATAKLYTGGERLPIGRPIDQVEAWVLDSRGNPVPIGVIGELCLGGTGLARGYLHRPEQTAASFVPHPFAVLPGERLYRTGDLAIRQPDGEIELLGRIDQQVKLRGFRIDLGEIEAVLCALAGVREAAVVARAWGSGDRRLIAYVVGDVAADALRRSLRERLPDYMVPAAFVTLAALPLTPNGKVDKKALPAPQLEIPENADLAPRTPVEKIVAGIWCEVLAVPRVGFEDNFFDLGGHSLLLPRVQARLHAETGRKVSLVELLTHTTVRALARHLEPGEAAPLSTAERVPAKRAPDGDAIAIVGLSGRFPGAADVEQLWANLCAGVSSIVRFSDDELAAAGVDPALRCDPHYVPAGGALDGVELFDADFFGYTPREAAILNPQHRLFLECAWEALEDAGYDSRRVPGPVGLFAGLGFNTYLRQAFTGLDRKMVSQQQLLMGNDKDFLPTSVSYKLDLKGPSMAVQTACSSSLVAVHLACQNLLLGACDMALAGGVSIALPQRAGYLYEEGGINSPDGCCRPFDAAARGAVRGSGAGIVVLKRLADALAHGDTIRAVIRGSAVNNDGSAKAGYTAPSVAGQAEVITMALTAAGVDPATISYVEAHGTGTVLGDPIEVEALAQAFRRGGPRERSCALGSAKSNLGHLDTAAGVAGLIKATLALQHGVLPPSLGFSRPNPQIDFAAGPFHVQTELADWERGSSPRRAGVSSLGIGGTNAHVVLEEAPPPEQPEPSGASRPLQLLLLSARTAGALEEATARLATWLERHPEASLADTAYTLRVGRRPFDHRRMLVCASREDALAALQSRDPERLLERRRESDPPPVAWLLPGQGSQHPGMGRDLYETEPVFRREIDACAGILAPRLGRDLREILFSSPGSSSSTELAETRFAQPALFAVEQALARLWLSWGLRPQAFLGHSLGEYVAACLAGVLSVDDALTLVAARGELMQELPPGAMLSFGLSEDEALAEIAAAPSLSLAAVNGPGQCVVSGPAAEIAALGERLARRAVPCRRLHTSHAFHSQMMEPILDRFAGIVSRVELRPPSIPYLSNLTGTWITAAEATDPRYWTRHLREPVRFGDGVTRLLAELPPGAVLLEAGPGNALGRLVRGRAAGRTVLASMPHPDSPESGVAALLRTVGRLWLAGVEIDWQAFQGAERRRRVPLPTYPFQRQRFWVEAPRHGLAAGPAAVDPSRFMVLGAGEPVRATADLRSLLRDPGNAEVLQRLLDAEPGLRVLLPLPQETGPALKPGAPAEPSEPGDGHRRPELPTPYREPQSEVEQRLATIWGELFGIDQVGVHDDFFELGGHSLLALRLLSRLREDFSCEIPLETIFAAPTVSRLSAHLAAGGEPPAPRTSRILPAPRTGDLPLSFAQQRLLFLAVMAPGDPSYNLPLGLRLDGRLETRALRLAFDAVVARHEPLRTTFRIEESRVTQVIAPAARHLLPLADLAALPAGLADAEARRLALEQARHPFDLLRGPLVIALLVRLAPTEHVLLLTVHHIAADGWSCAVLYRDLTELYRALAEGRRPLLPELPVQYADFAAWQRAGLQEEALERHLDYWRIHLAGARAPALPTDRPRLLRPSGRGATLSMGLSAGTVAAARRLAREEDATLFMILLATFAVILHRASGCDDLVIGTDIANRNRRETEDLIGLFVNQLVLRTDLSGNPTFRELLRRVRRITLNAYAHQDAPFDRLVEALNPVRDLGTTPLFQVKLVLQNARMPIHKLTDLRVSPLGVHNQTAKFDLLLNLSEMGDTVSGILEYSTDLWDEASMQRLLGDFATALATGTVRPDERLSRIMEDLSRPSPQPAEERRTILRRRAIPVSLE